MSHFLYRLSILVIIGLTGLSIAARAVGTAKPSNPGLAGFTEGCENKPQPCWYGIVPGLTTVDEASVILASIGYLRGPFFFFSPHLNLVGPIEQMPQGIYLRYAVTDSNAVIYSISLSDWDITLGDLMGVLGSSGGMGGGFTISNPFLAYTNSYGVLLVEFYSMPTKFSPTKVKVNYVLLTQFQRLGDNLVKWHGFVPKWRYCMLEPEFLFCP